jgi:hypothetical protein
VYTPVVDEADFKGGILAVADTDDASGAEIIAGEDLDYHLIVSYVTETAGPPHRIVLRDSIHGWIDVPMTARESNGQTTWSADLTSSLDQGPIQVEFKLVLDGERWMAGQNQLATTGAPEAKVELDDRSVKWEN